MNTEQRRTLKAQLEQRAQLYLMIAMSLPDDWAHAVLPSEEARAYAVTFLAEFRQELQRRAHRALVASKAVLLSGDEKKGEPGEC